MQRGYLNTSESPSGRFALAVFAVLLVTVLALDIFYTSAPLSVAPPHPRTVTPAGCEQTASASTALPTVVTARELFSLHRVMRVFIVVFKEHARALETVRMMLTSDLLLVGNFSITVICNRGVFAFPNEEPFITYARSLLVLHNDMRSHLSRGHLARDWNTGLVRGFGSLLRPLADVVVLVQGDVQLQPTWAVSIHSALTQPEPGGTFFIQQGMGDAFMALTAEAVRHIGIFDENFSDRPSYQEGDYFLRAVAYARERVSITDPKHYRMHRPHAAASVLVHSGEGDGDYVRGWGVAPVSKRWWELKWPGIAAQWPRGGIFPPDLVKSPAVKLADVYPYFECDIYDRVRKGYYFECEGFEQEQ